MKGGSPTISTTAMQGEIEVWTGAGAEVPAGAAAGVGPGVAPKRQKNDAVGGEAGAAEVPAAVAVVRIAGRSTKRRSRSTKSPSEIAREVAAAVGIGKCRPAILHP